MSVPAAQELVAEEPVAGATDATSPDEPAPQPQTAPEPTTTEPAPDSETTTDGSATVVGEEP